MKKIDSLKENNRIDDRSFCFVKYLIKKVLIVSLIVLMITVFNVVKTYVNATDVATNNSDVNLDLGLTTDAKSAILMESSTGTIIYAKNAYTHLAPASMTKIMTMILVMDALKDGVIKMNQMLTASKNATDMGGTQIYLEVGEQMSVEDLLKAVAMASANDAAVVFAEAISGSIEGFVTLMNKKVSELGLKDTNFVNTNGLPAENHYSSAYDMAVMGCYLINNYEDTILKYTNIYEDYLRKGSEDEFWLVNTNKLVKMYPEIDGLKTGWTTDAGYCLTATMKKDGIRFVSVIMGGSTSVIRNSETVQMLSYGVSSYELVSVCKKGDIVKEVVDIKTKPNCYHIIIPNDINILVKKGDKIGEVTTNMKDLKLEINIDKNLYQELDLVIEENIEKASFFDITYEVMKRLFLG